MYLWIFCDFRTFLFNSFCQIYTDPSFFLPFLYESIKAKLKTNKYLKELDLRIRILYPIDMKTKADIFEDLFASILIASDFEDFQESRYSFVGQVLSDNGVSDDLLEAFVIFFGLMNSRKAKGMLDLLQLYGQEDEYTHWMHQSDHLQEALERAKEQLAFCTSPNPEPRILQ